MKILKINKSKLTFSVGFSSMHPDAEGWQQRGDSRQQVARDTILIRTGEKNLNTVLLFTYIFKHG